MRAEWNTGFVPGAGADIGVVVPVAEIMLAKPTLEMHVEASVRLDNM